MLSTSLARPAKHAARGMASTNLMARVRQQPVWRRHLVTIHDAKGQFVTIDDSGALVSKEVIISRGGEDESFVQLDREVGLAMKSAIVRQIGASLTSDPEAIPLKFYHTSLHFAHGMPADDADRAAAISTPDHRQGTRWAGSKRLCQRSYLVALGPPTSELTLDDTPDRK